MGTSSSPRTPMGCSGVLDTSGIAPAAIPSQVTAWLGVRADTSQQVPAAHGGLVAAGFNPAEESWTPATPMDAELTARFCGAVAATPPGRDEMHAVGTLHGRERIRA